MCNNIDYTMKERTVDEKSQERDKGNGNRIQVYDRKVAGTDGVDDNKMLLLLMMTMMIV